MNLDYFLYIKKGESICPRSTGQKWSRNKIEAELPEFFRDNQSAIVLDMVQIYEYPGANIYVTIDIRSGKSFFVEYGS